jgi:glutamyl-Q tRNA(Asp) synthetase
MPIRSRFAPSPTGALHLGNAYAALKAQELCPDVFLLRIEDIDFTRCRQQFTNWIYEDLHWLGITWQETVRIQSEHHPTYHTALAALAAQSVLYPCTCTRQQIKADLHTKPAQQHSTYSGRCRARTMDDAQKLRAQNIPYALRLNMDKAMQIAGNLRWYDLRNGQYIPANPAVAGDIILARKDIGLSYHLAVTVDDALQRITRITRGMDLYDSTHIHCLLQALLGYPTPEYYHHDLFKDSSGERFAKTKGSRAIRDYRAEGYSASDVRDMVYTMVEGRCAPQI